MPVKRNLRQAVLALRRGGIVAYATESVFGLGCDPTNAKAVQRLLRLKRRTSHKGLILIAAHQKHLLPYVTELPKRALETWPGPYTWIVTAKADAPYWITGQHASIAVRITAHPQAAALCHAFGQALVSTSANRAGQHPARHYRETLRRFGQYVDYVLPGRVGGAKRPTRIADARTGKLIRAD